MGGGQRRQTQAGGLQAGAQPAAAGRGETHTSNLSDHLQQKQVDSGRLWLTVPPPAPQRLAGATLLVFANKQDLPGALSKAAIQEVTTAEHFPPSHRSRDLSHGRSLCRRWPWTRSRATIGASSAAAR